MTETSVEKFVGLFAGSKAKPKPEAQHFKTGPRLSFEEVEQGHDPVKEFVSAGERIWVQGLLQSQAHKRWKNSNSISISEAQFHSGLSTFFSQTLSPHPQPSKASPTRLAPFLPFVPAPPFNDGFSLGLGGMLDAPASPTTNNNEDIMSFGDMRHSNSMTLMQQSRSKEDAMDLLVSSNDFNIDIGNFLDGILSEDEDEDEDEDEELSITNEASKPALPESNPF